MRSQPRRPVDRPTRRAPQRGGVSLPHLLGLVVLALVVILVASLLVPTQQRVGGVATTTPGARQPTAGPPATPLGPTALPSTNTPLPTDTPEPSATPVPIPLLGSSALPLGRPAPSQA